MFFQQPSTSEANWYSVSIAIERCFPCVTRHILDDVSLDQSFQGIQNIFAFVGDIVVAPVFLNLGKSEPTSFFSPSCSDDCQCHTLFRSDLIPKPSEVIMARLHELVQHYVHIIDSHIGLAPFVAVIDNSPTHQMDQIWLISCQLANLFHSK